MRILAKKDEKDKRTVQIKFLVTDEENKKLKRYAGLYNQSYSDFIRSAIERKMRAFDDITLPKKGDPRFSSGIMTKTVRKELKTILQEDDIMEDLKDVIPLKKINENEAREREDHMKKRMENLEKELETIKKTIGKQ